VARVEAVRSFSQTLPEACADEWTKAIDHPFVVSVAEGSLEAARFQVWIQQDNRFVQGLRRFLDELIAIAPDDDRAGLESGLAALDPELELFAEYAQRERIRLDVPALPACDDYVRFLRDRIADGFAHALTAYYGCERSYLDAWTGVRGAADAGGPYARWIDNWSSELFRAYVDWLGSRVDVHTVAFTDDAKDELRHVFRQTVEFEVAFWDTCWAG